MNLGPRKNPLFLSTVAHTPTGRQNAQINKHDDNNDDNNGDDTNKTKRHYLCYGQKDERTEGQGKQKCAGLGC